MFTKSGMIELHNDMHERFDVLLRHVATVQRGSRAASCL